MLFFSFHRHLIAFTVIVGVIAHRCPSILSAIVNKLDRTHHSCLNLSRYFAAERISKSPIVMDHMHLLCHHGDEMKSQFYFSEYDET